MVPASSRASRPRCCTPSISEHAKAGAVYETLARGETSRRVELRRRKDGTTFWSRADGRAVDPLDPHRGSVWIVEDVTERRRARRTCGGWFASTTRPRSACSGRSASRS